MIFECNQDAVERGMPQLAPIGTAKDPESPGADDGHVWLGHQEMEPLHLRPAVPGRLPGEVDEGRRPRCVPPVYRAAERRRGSLLPVIQNLR